MDSTVQSSHKFFIFNFSERTNLILLKYSSTLHVILISSGVTFSVYTLDFSILSWLSVYI